MAVATVIEVSSLSLLFVACRLVCRVAQSTYLPSRPSSFFH
jgi:hypothetical protein